MKKCFFGKTPEGKNVDLYILKNKQGTEAGIINYGGIITYLKTPDKHGHLEDIVLGFDNLEAYLKNNFYFGCLVGRYSNRIAKGKFSLNDKQYSLAVNNGENHLHGGIKGFDKVVWNVTEYKSENNESSLSLNYLSEEAEEGYPGNLDVNVKYTLTEKNELKIQYQATTDKDTIINLTNHSYFNLLGSGEIFNHQIMINSDYFTPIDNTQIPTGEIKSVTNSPFDLRELTEIKNKINTTDEQILIANGYDHNWVLNSKEDISILAVKVYEPNSGRILEVYTTQPGIQFYTGNFLNNTIIGKNNHIYDFRTGFCLETQHFPDSPNQSNFPSTVLKVDEIYNQTTIYKFGTD